MPEIWEHPFGYASLKIERAKEHISDIEKRLLASPDRYGPGLHVDLKTGEQFLHYRLTDRTLTREIALIVGDAVHNLHSALDIAWLESVRKSGAIGFNPSRTKFPVTKTRHELETNLLRTVKLSSTSPLFDMVVNRVKTYAGGDADIVSLHQLDIDDKHHILIPMLTVTAIDGVELQHEDGGVEKFSITLSRHNSYRKVVPLGTKVKNHGEARFLITFREGEFLEGQEVIPTLLRLSAKVTRIVRILQRM